MIFLYVILSVILVFCLFGAVLLFLKNEFGIEYIFKEDSQSLFLRFKILKIPFKIPLVLEKKHKEKEKKAAQKEKKKGIGIKKYISLASKIKETYAQTKEEISEILHNIPQKIEFSEVFVDLAFGTGNAAHTGMLNGAVWTSSTLVLRIIKEMFGLKKCSLNIVPNFEKKCFTIHIKSILRLRMVYIIIIIFRAFKIADIFKNKIIKNNEKAVYENDGTSN